MKSHLSISIAKMSTFLSIFESYSMSREDVFRLLGINPMLLASPDSRLDAGEIGRIVQEALRLSKDEDIGLKQGEKLARGFSNLIGFILFNCPNLEEAVRKYCQYESLVDGTSLTEVTITQDSAVVTINILEPLLASNRPFIDYKIAGTLSYAKVLSGKDFKAREIHFQYEQPTDIAEYRRIFQCPVRFSRPVNRIIVERENLNLLVTEPNKDLLSIFEAKAREMMPTFQTDEVYAQKVMQLIIKEIHGGVPSIGSIAQQLTVSPRTLQLYLKREGTTYLELMNEARKNVAFNYLKNPVVPVNEIAYLLGFSETSAFHRAFKKWTRLTPREFRNNYKTGLG